MKIRQLYIFKTVCEEESITKAAEHLSLAQSAVSRTISELEDTLGTQLFDRYSRKVYLNETGRLLLSKIIPLLDLYEDLEKCSKELGKLSSLKIGSTETIASFILPSIMKQFQLQYGFTPIQVTVDNSRNIEEMLTQHQLDIGLIEGVITGDHLEKIPFSDFPLSILCTPDHIFSTDGDYHPDLLAAEPWILREKGTPIREALDGAMMFYNLSVSPIWTSTTSVAIKEAVKQDMGITILPRILVKRELEEGTLKELYVENFSLSCTNHLVFHKDKYQTVAFQAFINQVMFHG